MAEHHVRRLSLRVRAARDERATARAFGERVLEACGDELERRAPGRVVFIKRLPVRWHLLAGEIADDQVAQQLAEELADAIERIAADAAGPDASAAGEDVAVFSSEADWVAAWLRAVVASPSRAASSWVFRALHDRAADVASALCAPGSEPRSRAALAVLARAGDLAAVVRTWSPGAAARICATLYASSSEPSVTHALPGAEPSLRPEPWAIVRELLVDRAQSAAAGQRPASPVSPAPSPAGLPASERPESAPEPRARDSARNTDPDGVFRTAWGGLFHLISIVDEIGAAEALYSACIDERAALASAAVGLAHASDPAVAWFGGVLPTEVAVTQAQWAEAAPRMLDGCAHSFPRRGLAELPEIDVGLCESPGGRLLVAVARGRPFALFAWPAATPGEAEVGLRAFLDHWPVGARRPRAAPAVAELDARGIVLPDPTARLVGVLMPDAPTPLGAAALAQTLGSACAVFDARTQYAAGATVPEFATRFLAIPGQIRVRDDTLMVTLAVASIDLDVRRAGLDRNPGWVPWLERTVTIELASSRGGVV